MIAVRDPVERVILVAAPRKGSSDAAQIQEHLDELADLVDTAGAVVVDRVTQQVAAPNPATLIGEGKVAELRDAMAARDGRLRGGPVGGEQGTWPGRTNKQGKRGFAAGLLALCG